LWKYYVLMYESRKMGAVETILRMGGGEEIMKNDRRMNLTKIHCKHFCKWHNVPPVKQ
jgi:hypothetical protein